MAHHVARQLGQADLLGRDGQVISTAPVAAAAPATAVTPSLRLATLSMIPLIFPIMVVTYI